MDSPCATDVVMDTDTVSIKDEKKNFVDNTMVLPNDICDAPTLMSSIDQSTDTNVDDYRDEINKDKIELQSGNDNSSSHQTVSHNGNGDETDSHIEQKDNICKATNKNEIKAKLVFEEEKNKSYGAMPFENLTCNICLQRLKEPKLLPCLHSYCLHCLEKLCCPPTETLGKNDTGEESLNLKPDELTKKGDNSLPESISTSEVHVEESQSTSTAPNTNEKLNSIQCPTCNGTCEIPPDGVEGLTTNFVLLSMIKTAELLTKNAQCEICKLRDLVEDAVAFCTDCSDMLCKSCWQNHTFTRFTLTHKIVPLDEVKDHVLDSAIKNQSAMKCKDHCEEILKYFCSDCRCLLCRECLLLSHQGHSCVSSSVAAQARREDLKSLLYGFNERLVSIRTDETQEYEMQMERINKAENIEVEKINDFYSNFVNAIEKDRKNVVKKTKQEFNRIKTQCENRLASYQNVEKCMTDLVSIVHLIGNRACDNELLKIEPMVHRRLVQLVNKDIKPYPVSWYSLPEACQLNPIQISCEGQKIELSLFKTTSTKQKFEPTNSIPNQRSLAELMRNGKFKDHLPQSAQESTNREMSSAISTKELEKTSQKDPKFIDATIWPQTGKSKDVLSIKQNADKITDLENSNSDWTDSSTEIPSTSQKPAQNGKTKRSRRGGKKKKGRKEIVDIQNILQGISLQNKGMMNPISSGLIGNYNVADTSIINRGTPATSHVSNPHHLLTAGSTFGSGISVHSTQDKMQSVKFPSEYAPISQLQAGASVQQTKPLVISGSLNQQQTKEESKVMAQSTKPPNPASSTASARVISLQPKWRLDVKLSSDIYEPNLQGVFCLHSSSIVVSDIKNSKVKTFSIKGEFLRTIDVKYVGRAIFTANILVHSARSKVCGKKEDGKEITMNFDNSPNCLVTWFPKGNFLVANGNKIRQYAVDQDHFIKKKTINVEGGTVKEIVDIRCDMQGQRVVVVDSSNKSVVLFNLEGQIIGTYVEDENSVWNPTSACFDKKGYIFVTDGGGNRLVFLSQTGKYIQQWDTCPTINKPTFVATNPLQPLYLTGHDRYVHVYDYAYL